MIFAASDEVPVLALSLNENFENFRPLSRR